MENKPLVPVEFIGSASPYHAGDVAGFTQDEADALIKKGVAKEYVPPKAAADKSGKTSKPAE